MGSVFRIARSVVDTLLFATYPLAVYVGLTRYSMRDASLVLGALVLVGVLLRLPGRSRRALLPVLALPLSILGLIGTSVLLDDPRFVLALPVLINLALLAQFALSLRGVPLVERFARLTETSLSDAQIAYCRTVTKVWCGFFVVNGATAGLLALMAPLAWWALYTGILSYVLMGTLFTIEYVVRKARFRIFGGHLLDRALARVFPPPAEVKP